MLILSSRMRPKEQFEGYAFVGTDYVHGPAGMTAYRARNCKISLRAMKALSIFG